VNEPWYSLSGEEVADRLDVDPAVGLSSERAAELLSSHGPNALPAEPPVPGWRRFAEQYRTYMQMILVAMALWESGKLLARAPQRRS
jgi:Ca2+-transporting ATPase